jgi:cytochrome c
MKKVIFGFLGIIIFALTSTAQTNSKKTQAPAPAQSSKATVSKADIEAGKQLIAKSDCFACHKLNEKSVGPSYIDVAKKYPITEKNINILSEKIIKGGSGVWGQIPMSPHATISDQDSKQIVKYILSLNAK